MEQRVYGKLLNFQFLDIFAVRKYYHLKDYIHLGQAVKTAIHNNVLYEEDTLFKFSNIHDACLHRNSLPDPHFFLIFFARTINGIIFHNVFLP